MLLPTQTPHPGSSLWPQRTDRNGNSRAEQPAFSQASGHPFTPWAQLSVADPSGLGWRKFNNVSQAWGTEKHQGGGVASFCGHFQALT